MHAARQFVEPSDATGERSFASPPRARDLWIARAGLVAAALFAVTALWQQRGYVPIWDARVYADCIVRAATESSPLQALRGGALRCAEHPSQVYVGLQALAQRLAPGSYLPMLATNVVLLGVAAWAFSRVLRAALPAPSVAPERAWLVAALLVQPLVLATVVQINLDFPVLVFLTGALAAALERRRWAMVGWGLLATFSKESGGLLFAALAAIYVLVFELPAPVSRATRAALALGAMVAVIVVSALPEQPHVVPLAVVAGLVAAAAGLPRPWTVPADGLSRTALRSLPLALPPLALATYLAWRASTPHATVLWGEGERQTSLAVALLRVHRGADSLTWLGALFVMSFAWICTAPVLVDAAIGIRRYLAERRPRVVPELSPAAATTIASLLAATAYLLTRLPVAALPRYMVPGVPLLLAATGVALVRLGVGPGLRRALLPALVILFAASAFRPLDPVSRLVWGTFPSGSREHLYVRCSTDLCHDNGLDISVVNLQFANFAAVMQAALDRVQPAPGRPVALSIEGDWMVIGPLTREGRRTLRPWVARPPVVVHGEALARGAAVPDTAWYLGVPWVRDSALLTAVGRRYVVGPPDSVRVGGDAVAVRRLTRRAAAR